ncbi:hypothetical protein DFS34DRAFT_600005 [Phlyctochytrium arcticum]|nr:hypothetical protein DFS34DRAFT_600005 [Phlyctochytrium arcticum]
MLPSPPSLIHRISHYHFTHHYSSKTPPMPATTSTRPLVIITGANRGIGFDLAKDLHAAQFDVLVTARDAKNAAEAVKKVKTGDASVDAATLDTSDATSITHFVQTTLPPLIRDSKRPVYLVNNAGIFGTISYRPVLTTNVIGPIKLTQAFIDLLKASPSVKGAVIGISSTLGNKTHSPSHLVEQLKAHPFKTPSKIITQIESGAYDGEDAKLAPVDGRPQFENYQYNFSKYLLNIATELFAQANPAIPVLAVDPGWVQTEMGGKNATGTVQSAVDRITFHLKADLSKLPARSGQVWAGEETLDWRNN